MVYTRRKYTKYETCAILNRFHILYISWEIYFTDYTHILIFLNYILILYIYTYILKNVVGSLLQVLVKCT